MKINFGGSFLTMLTIVFIALKLAEVGAVATWSWWLVLSPLWVPVAILFLLWGALGLLCVIYKK